MGGILLEIATPDKLVFSGEVDYITAKGGLGEFTVLPKHSPLLTTIEPGVVRFASGGEVKELAVGWGYAEVRPYKVLMLVEFAQFKDEIDADELERQLQEISSKLKDASLSNEEKEALEKQLERLKAKKKLLVS